MEVGSRGAQRASFRTLRLVGVLALAAIALAVSSGPAAAVVPAPSLAHPLAAASSTPRVLIVVGPVGSTTSHYIAIARQLAGQARSYGASVTELYSPNATWERVRTEAAGANVLVYLGHGNGTPSPYSGGPDTHNGLGLNASLGGNNSNVRYYGGPYVAKYFDLAPNAVVILNHLCYASGNNEWGKGNPAQSVAIQRVDNYGEGFLKAGAAAVFAEAITDPGYILDNLFHSDRSMADIFWASPNATRQYEVSFSSKRVTGARALMDPYKPSRYYRSVIGRLTVTAADWR